MTFLEGVGMHQIQIFLYTNLSIIIAKIRIECLYLFFTSDSFLSRQVVRFSIELLYRQFILLTIVIAFNCPSSSDHCHSRVSTPVILRTQLVLLGYECYTPMTNNSAKQHSLLSDEFSALATSDLSFFKVVVGIHWCCSNKTQQLFLFYYLLLII